MSAPSAELAVPALPPLQTPDHRKHKKQQYGKPFVDPEAINIVLDRPSAERRVKNLVVGQTGVVHVEVKDATIGGNGVYRPRSDVAVVVTGTLAPHPQGGAGDRQEQRERCQDVEEPAEHIATRLKFVADTTRRFRGPAEAERRCRIPDNSALDRAPEDHNRR